ncbi:MAG: zinc-binding alcohol dehydrogenase family protein [Polyangiales bacterium]
MKAVLLKDYGPSENLVLGEVPQPQVGNDDVLVKVAYAGLRWGDIMQRNGFPTRARKTPFVAGQEASGVVEAVGANVTRYKPGMRVMAMPFDGAWAEYLAVPQARLVPVPERVSLEQMLAYPVNLLTAYYAVNVWGKVQPGERVLLHAAAGGVGLLALQIMKRRLKDVTVVALAGSEEKLELVRRNGADHAINYKTTNYVDEINRLLGPKASGILTGGERGGGVDVSLNGVSGPTLDTDWKVIRKRGRWVIYGWAGGRGTLNTGAFGYDGITVMPFSSIAWMGTPEHRDGLAFVRDWLETEPLLEPTVYGLDQVAEIEAAMEQGRTSGKVVFKV